jgi:hypothetical protein
LDRYLLNMPGQEQVFNGSPQARFFHGLHEGLAQSSGFNNTQGESSSIIYSESAFVFEQAEIF